MAHLQKFRRGWENEHLATFLLSRISFVATPLKIADDIGTDLFCTLFEVKDGELLPRNSFAIQIKSSKEAIDATGKIEYLRKLELPFFVGVVDRINLTMSVYSGEYLPIFFAHHGIPQHLTLSLEEENTSLDNYTINGPAGRFTLRMPHVVVLEASAQPDNAAAQTDVLGRLCSRMLQHISALVSQEYVFKVGDGRVVIFAGPGSAETFRDNFYYRLAEAFRNFRWLYVNHPDQFSFREFEIFENCYRRLTALGPIPSILEASYESIKRELPATPNDK